MSGQMPAMALRLSGQLLLGASKIYHRKARYLLDDCTDALTRLRLSSTASSKDVDLAVVEPNRTAITLDNAGNGPQSQSRPQPEEDSFDLEGFLNAPLEQPVVDLKQKPVEVGRLGKTGEPVVQPVSFGGVAGDDLLDEFAGLMGEGVEEVEVGRRQSSMAGRPSDSSIVGPPPLEPTNIDTIGTIDEELELKSLKDSLQFSPLRQPLTSPNQPDQPDPLFSSPASSIKRRRDADNTASRPRRRRITNLMDNETELSTSQLQSQLKNHQDLLLPRQSPSAAQVMPASLSELLSKPGALLLPMGTDLSGLFAATMSIKPDSASVVAEPDTLADDTDNDPFTAIVDDVQSVVSVVPTQQSTNSATVELPTLLRSDKPIILSSLLTVPIIIT